MNKALERISSGLRLNHAVDDAAGASIVNRMTSQIKGIEAAIRNAADAISLTQTAEGSLEEVSQILHRMRELQFKRQTGFTLDRIGRQLTMKSRRCKMSLAELPRAAVSMA